MKNGVKDIKKHRWFKKFSWENSEALKITPPYFPKVKSDGDTSNYSEYPDSPELPKAIKSKNDPFLSW